MAAEPVTSVLVADDHPLFLEGLVAALASEPSIQVVAAAADGAEAVRLASELQPRVAVLDLHMPEFNGIEATRRLVECSPETKVLVLTMVENDEAIFGALRAGAAGYLLKGASRHQIVRAVHAVAEGGAVFSSEVAQRVIRGQPSSADHGPKGTELTARELEVAELAAQGLTNSAIAERLCLSQKTVRNYVSNVILKLHVEDRAGLAQRLREKH